MHQTDTCPLALLNYGPDFFEGASVASSSIQAAAGGGGGWWGWVVGFAAWLPGEPASRPPGGSAESVRRV